MTDTWILHLTPADMSLLRWGLDEARNLATPSWRRRAEKVREDLARHQLDPRRTYEALAPITSSSFSKWDAAERSARVRLRELLGRIKDAVEIVAALQETCEPDQVHCFVPHPTDPDSCGLCGFNEESPRHG